MECSDSAEKPKASQGDATELENRQPNEQPKEVNNQAAAPQCESTSDGGDDGKMNSSQPDKIGRTEEPNETLNAFVQQEKKETETSSVKQEESEILNTQLDGIEETPDGKSEKTLDASKPTTTPDISEGQKEKVSLESPVKEDTASAKEPEAEVADEEQNKDVNESNEAGGPKPGARRDDVLTREPEEQKGRNSEVDKSGTKDNVTDIDTKPTDTGSEHIILTASKKEKEHGVVLAGDASIQDPMDIDSKLDEGEKNSRQTKEEERSKRDSAENALNQTSEDDKETPVEHLVSAQNPEHHSRMPQPATRKTLSSVSAERETAAEAPSPTEKGQDIPDMHTEGNPVKDEECLPKDIEDNESTRARSRRSSTRSTYEPRTLRPRTSGRVNNTGSTSESPAVQDPAPENPRSIPGSSIPKPTPMPSPVSGKQHVVDEDNTPRPIMEAKGLVMRIDDAIFVTEDQLDEFKIARLTDKKVKPFEQLTFQDLRTYNRDQLRAYCFAYGMARRKKTEMEADMARYLSYWNKGREGFALHEYVPTSSRVIDRVEPNPADSVGAIRAAATVQVGSASREGSATPTTSNGKASASAKPSSSRGATPSRSAGPVVNSNRVSGSQGSSALSSASPAGGPTSTGNSQVPGVIQVGAQRSVAVTRTAKATSGAPVLPRGFGTSFKQRVHARQAGAKFKAAYNGAGPAIVNIVENAAAYFEGKDSPEVILDQAKSYERYQFNVDMLNEIFDGVPDGSDEAADDVEMTGIETSADTNDAPTNATQATARTGHFKKNVLENIASRVASGKRKVQAADLDALEKQFKEMEEHTKYTERTNMRLFQRLERADTKEQIESVKQEFETIHKIKFDDGSPRPLVRRKLDKSRPPLVMSDEKCRILRFKVS